MADYFKHMFHTNNQSNWQQVVDFVEKKVIDSMNARLVSQYTAEEVTMMTLKQMHPTKAPSLDGMSLCCSNLVGIF